MGPKPHCRYSLLKYVKIYFKNQYTACCYNLTISAHKEASGSAMTSNSLSVNSPACLQNISCELSTHPQIGKSVKHLVHELASLHIVLSMNGKIPVTGYNMLKLMIDFITSHQITGDRVTNLHRVPSTTRSIH